MAKQGLEKFSDNPLELKSEPRISGDLISFLMLARYLGKTTINPSKLEKS
jgi:hypothetical protein